MSDIDVSVTRRLPIGAEPQAGGGVHFRVWAPRRQRVVVERGSARLELRREADGYFAGSDAAAAAGDQYWFRLDEDEVRYPDPASRFQPQGPHGPSQVVDPSAFAWSDDDRRWRGLPLEGQIIYEVHVGTYTREGTYAALERELPEIAATGITVLELMPIAEFPGRFGWGYDGVCLFAPTRLYGAPDDLRRLVDRAHSLGLAVILDVVYNHLGPDGNFMRAFTDTFFTPVYENEWGEAINFDGGGAQGVREFFVANAGYWVDEFHMDGLRLDATHTMHDRSKRHILSDIGQRVRRAARGRRTIVVCENESQQIRLVRPVERGGYGLDGIWNEDFHHSAVVALLGEREAYYTDYRGTSQEFISMVNHGFLYQGQYYSWQKKRRGSPSKGIPRSAIVTFIENHDQVANSAHGTHLHRLAAPGRLRAMTALLLLGPNTPLLFQGQEFASSAPFFYFADHRPELAAGVRKGRIEFLSQFASLADPGAQARIPAPDDPRTFERCVLDLDERRTHAEAYALHRDLLALRKRDPLFGAADARIDGAVLNDAAFVLRYSGDEREGDRLLLVNLGTELTLSIVNEPLLAPPEGARWAVFWSSEDPMYGGGGTPVLEHDTGWRLPGQAAIALSSVETPR